MDDANRKGAADRAGKERETIETKAKGEKKMKILCLIGLWILVLMIPACATLTYQAPDGTKVTYSRFMTSSDVIKGKVGDASVEARGQQVIDADALQKIISAMGK